VLINTDINYYIPDNNKNSYEVMGQGLKKLMVITNKNTLDVEDKLMLQKMLLAIHHDFNTDTFQLEINNENNINISQINITVTNIISFGIKPTQLGLDIPYQNYKPVIFDNLWALFADDLKTIRTQADKKQKLWNCLKVKFL